MLPIFSIKIMRLVDYKENELWRGTVLRINGYCCNCCNIKEKIDFMITEYFYTESGLALYCISGYHAGQLKMCFPKDALNHTSHSISKDWLVKNLNKYINIKGIIEDISIVI